MLVTKSDQLLKISNEYMKQNGLQWSKSHLQWSWSSSKPNKGPSVSYLLWTTLNNLLI